MIGLLISTHSTLARGFMDAAEMIIGPQENVVILPFMNGENVDELREKMEEAGKAFLAQGFPYCIFVDLFGASPFNAALMANPEIGANVVAGTSLGLLLEFLTQREMFTGSDTTEFLDELVANVGTAKRINISGIE